MLPSGIANDLLRLSVAVDAYDSNTSRRKPSREASAKSLSSLYLEIHEVASKRKSTRSIAVFDKEGRTSNSKESSPRKSTHTAPPYYGSRATPVHWAKTMLDSTYYSNDRDARALASKEPYNTKIHSIVVHNNNSPVP